MRRTNPAGMELIRTFEGCELVAYKDCVGTWTIGYGSTHCVFPGLVISRSDAAQRLMSDLIVAERAVEHSVSVPLSDNQFSSLVSFVFNLGGGALEKSTLLKKLNAGNYEEVPAELSKWCYAGGKIMGGLKKRRDAEGKLWATPC